MFVKKLDYGRALYRPSINLINWRIGSTVGLGWRNRYISLEYYQLFNRNEHSFLKSWFFGTQQFSFNSARIFSLKDTLKIPKPLSSSLNPLFKKECHLLSDKLESMKIYTTHKIELTLHLKVGL